MCPLTYFLTGQQLLTQGNKSVTYCGIKKIICYILWYKKNNLLHTVV
jgi:hypothetical protein